MVYSDPNKTNSIAYQHTLLSYWLKTSHWNISSVDALHLYNMADRGEKLQKPHCYHPFSDSRDTYLTKNHYENYSPKMVPTNPTGSWTNSSCQHCRALTHWGRVTHICVSKLTIIGSDNGLSTDRRQAIIWTNAGLFLIGTLGTNFSELQSRPQCVNSSYPGQNDRHFAHHIFRSISVNAKFFVSITFSLKFYN